MEELNKALMKELDMFWSWKIVFKVKGADGHCKCHKTQKQTQRYILKSAVYNSYTIITICLRVYFFFKYSPRAMILHLETFEFIGELLKEKVFVLSIICDTKILSTWKKNHYSGVFTHWTKLIIFCWVQRIYLFFSPCCLYLYKVHAF